MKTIKILTLFAAITALFSFRTGNVCETYFPQKVGTKWEQTSYDSVNAISGKSHGEVISVEDITDGLQATISVETFDKNNTSTNKGTLIMKCQGDKFLMDMSNMFKQMQIPEMPGLEMEITNNYMDFPSHPVAGQKLDNYSSAMNIKMKGTLFMTVTINVTNRKVEGFESVTTDAGKFDCIKLSSDTEVVSANYGSKSHSVMWMAKNVGMVKNESYYETGKLKSTNKLTSFTE